MSVLSSLFQLLTSLPHPLFLTCLSFFCSLCPSLWAFLQFAWRARGQQTNTGPGPRQAKRTQSSGQNSKVAIWLSARSLCNAHSRRLSNCTTFHKMIEKMSAAFGQRDEQRNQPPTWSMRAADLRKEWAVCGAVCSGDCHVAIDLHPHEYIIISHHVLV